MSKLQIKFMNNKKLGFIRDKTHIFNKYRDELHRGNTGPSDFGAGLINPGSANEPLNSKLINQATGIDTRFSDLENKITKLEELYKAKMKDTMSFDDPTAKDAQIEAMCKQITTDISNLRNEIKSDVTNEGSTEKKQIEQNLQIGHYSKLRDIMINFRNIQSTYLNRLKAKSDVGNPSLNETLDFGDDIDSFTPEQNAQVMQNEIVQSQRYREIEEMQSVIAQINQMVSDLSTLIIEQGTMLDRIDGYIETAIIEVEAGNKELTKAEKDSKSKCFYIYLLLMIILILILGTIVLVRKNKNKPPSTDNSGDQKNSTSVLLGMLSLI